MDGCWLIIDDYGGPADNSKVSSTKILVDELVNSGNYCPSVTWLGSWVGRSKASCFLVPDDKMDNTIWRGDEEAIEILA